MRSFTVFLLLLAAAAYGEPQHSHPSEVSATARFGEVAFANSGAPAAQEDFLRGLALLHDFEYGSAAENFRKAQQIDAGFAMAYWGEAMTYTHPIWFQQNLAAARAVLQRLAPTASARREMAKTERERGYLDAVEILYGDGTKEARDFKYADAMAALHARFPDDVDATAFYALSLLGTAHKGRDFAIYMRAAALLEEVFPEHRLHPGVLHYLIHSYDDPIHAPLGLRAARLYGNVAPNAGHALHMTSHIFTAMGMWDQVLDANKRAIATLADHATAVCGHYAIWQHYALLQKERFDEANAALGVCRASAGNLMAMRGYATMRAAQAAGGGALEAGELAGAPDEVKFTIAYADALASALRKDAKRFDDAASRLRATKQGALDAIDNPSNPTDRLRVEVILQQADALGALLAGRREEAIAILQKAAVTEASMPLDFGPPVVEKPTYELLAETLLAAGRRDESLRAYETALSRAPNRTMSVHGAAR